ncbi:hypothetical protein SAY86_014127 [Trapa natans]|uniref:protein-serine/threonine phosphatase n=1 Tax=Trapa natans TaxID=22666 RepID=A0AAN7QMJ6_TRANT|nr:hypothetical protein SAY86_014127 [Trapa natans]
MSCSVAVSNSQALSLTLSHLKPSASSSSTCTSPSSSRSPSSPFRIHLQKPHSTLSNATSCGPATASNSGSGSSSAMLKRKRPTRLDIPNARFGLDVPAIPSASAPVVLDVHAEEIEKYGYSVYCKRGRREFLEDRVSAMFDINGDPKQAIFGVFDGHGGPAAAEFAASNLGKNVVNQIAGIYGSEEIKEGIKEGYLKTDSDFLKEEVRGGSCCVTALFRKGNLFVSNAGDCRAVISRGGVAESLTSDHRPSREDEKERIEAQGGYVDLYHGVWRIQGSLAVSRGIGDGHLKKWVTAEPETKLVEIIQAEDEFLILASDGLWDKVSNQEAVDIIRAFYLGTNGTKLMAACKKLVDLSASRGSCDDASVMVVRLKPYM